MPEPTFCEDDVFVVVDPDFGNVTDAVDVDVDFAVDFFFDPQVLQAIFLHFIVYKFNSFTFNAF